MLAYQNGNGSAFDLLYQRHKAPLYRYFLRQSVDQASAEELYQDVWLSLIRASARYQVTAKFTTYLYHLAHNKLIDHYRKNKKYKKNSYQQVNDENGEDELDQLPAGESDEPDYKLQENILLGRLKSILQDLPATQREAFLLKEEGGLSLEEIAEVCGVNAETAKSRIRYAVARIKKGLVSAEEKV